ncbi:MAG: acetyl-CoA C-acyltransferase [Rhodobacterales bacterium]|nr:MAG: acetyl-CoA C-acyltransferase [Rhodobacterales bacterium]
MSKEMTDPIVIVAAARTAMGGFQGMFAGVGAVKLGATAIGGAMQRSGLGAEEMNGAVNEVFMGCVLPAGLGQAPARQALLDAGLATSTRATTVNKMCGSGMKAAMIAHDLLVAGAGDVMVAGGMESMTDAPYLLPKGRGGLRMGHGRVLDHMFFDGLEDAYEPGRLMGTYAEDCARDYGFTREAQDEFAIRSLTRAKTAIEEGAFAGEIVPVTVKTRRGDVVIDTDEQPGKADIARIPTLRPAFAPDGTVTAANASSISDGAAALVMMRASEAEKRGLTPLARILGHDGHAHAANAFPTAPIQAMRNLADKTGLALKDVDLFEINEAFAVVPMAAMQDLDIPADKVNIHGGACALGHPIGASGARVLVTLLAALRRHDLGTGVASVCLGGGEAVAMAVERMK